MKDQKFKVWNTEMKTMSDTYTLQELIRMRPTVDNTDREIYLQYTGLKDINKTDIYVGDITESGWQVLFGGGMFIPYYDFGNEERIEDAGCDWWADCEIIGNIYENPSLLTKE